MRNIKYTLLQIFVKKIFVKNSGNICKKKNDMESFKFKNNMRCKNIKK